ncbi:MAG TPA: sulfatase [Vicinamibacteria bacterium]|nr:sulfatase [Vicinamibacteria bacterium]
MTIPRQLTTIAAALVLAGCGLQSCVSPVPAVDLLLRADRLVEASAAGQGREAVLQAGSRGLNIDDDLQRGFAAGPPGRLRFVVDIPRGGRLHVACGIDPRYYQRPGVEFFVKVRRQGREDLVWSQLLDPIAHPEHREFVQAEVDLSRWAGPGRELVLETRGYEETGDPLRAFWGAPTLTAGRAGAPLAIVYLVDTLRADHTGPYGYTRRTTPELDAFARDAVVFENAIAHASWTKPSVASILTSQLPARHRAVQLRDRLDPGVPTVARLLFARGFSTGAAIANSVIYDAGSGFDPGFEVFAGLHDRGDRRSKETGADVVVDSALQFLRGRRGLPTFLYAHTMDPHVPYTPPPPFDQMFEPHPTAEHPGRDPRTDYKEPLDRERMIAQYDGDIAFGDREFGRFLRELKKAGLYDGALIVFLADHGEEFRDHGRWLHGRSLFDELIRVPLVVKFPANRWAGRRIAQQVQGVDVVPTVLEALAQPVPGELAGEPLQRALSGSAKPRAAIAEISHRGFVAHGVRTDADKYVRRFSPEDDSLYFDLKADPREVDNRADANSQRVRTMEAQAQAAMSPNVFRYVVQVAGSGRYELHLQTRGWLEAVETTGFGPEERSFVGGNGRWLQAQVRPRPGAPREIAFTLRPVGAPVELGGNRDGRPLRPGELSVGEKAYHPDALPFVLPDLESELENEQGVALFRPPHLEVTGVRLWLALPPGRALQELDPVARERLRALGYLGPG